MPPKLAAREGVGAVVHHDARAGPEGTEWAAADGGGQSEFHDAERCRTQCQGAYITSVVHAALHGHHAALHGYQHQHDNAPAPTHPGGSSMRTPYSGDASSPRGMASSVLVGRLDSSRQDSRRTPA